MIIGNFGCEAERIKSKRKDKVINVDIREEVKPDVICNLAGDLPFEDNYFDYIYASHLLEHFSWRNTVGILNNWRRVLKEGGEIEILVPSFEYIVRQYQSTGAIPMPDLYGGQGHPMDIHFSAFDLRSLMKVMQDAGYREVMCGFRDYWGRKDLSLVGKGKK